MKKIIHLSDLHFGTERSNIVDILIEDVNQLKPDIIVMSGDLTQRAKRSQFFSAKKFFSSLKNAKIIYVPGNHDISLYNPLERFLYPFAKYKKWICPTLCTSLVQDNLAILGINSVTPFKPMGGYVTRKQLNLVTTFFEANLDKINIVIMHHNLIASERHKIINQAEHIIAEFIHDKVNMVLCGHIHHPFIEQINRPGMEHALYIITAGTAISTRTIQPNSFNVIEIEDNGFNLSVREFSDNEFITGENRYFSFK